MEVIKLEQDVAGTGHITNCYIAYDKDKNAVVIDPAYDALNIFDVLDKNGLKLKGIFVTHCHSDHTSALQDVIQKYPYIMVYMSDIDKENLNNEDVNCQKTVKTYVKTVNLSCVTEEKYVNIGEMNFELIHTPGHTSGSIVIFETNSNILFTGDTVFSNTYGRTDLPTGSHTDMRKSLDMLFDRFSTARCLPGHGEEFVLENVKRKINLLFAFKG